MAVSGVHYQSTPKFDSLPKHLGKLIINAISINTAYTSRVIVRYLLTYFIRRYFRPALEQNQLEQVCAEPPPAAVKVTLPAFAAERQRLLRLRCC